MFTFEERGRYKLVKSALNKMPTTGIIKSFTTESTIYPKAAPIITPTARSITLPFVANSRNSLKNEIFYARFG
jgi:hypothetical protein